MAPTMVNRVRIEFKYSAVARPGRIPGMNPPCLRQGDCLKLLRQLPDESVDLIVTDPPYIVHYKDRFGRSYPNDDNSRWVYPAFAELYRVLKLDFTCILMDNHQSGFVAVFGRMKRNQVVRKVKFESA